jgi:spore germination protein KB
LVQYSQALLGKWTGGAISLLFTAFCYFLASLLVGDLGYFLTTQVMVETPIESMMIIFIILAVITVRDGMQVYSRAAEVLFPWFVFLLIILAIPLITEFDLEKLKPFLEFGVRPVWEGSFSFFSLQEEVVFLMLYPFVAKGAGRRRAFIVGTALGGLILTVITVGCLVVLEPELTANQMYPAYTLAKNIGIGHMFERIEGLMMFIWVISIFMKTVICFHTSVIGFNQMFGIRDGRLMVWPMAMGLIPLALASYGNIVMVGQALNRSWTIFASIFLVIIPFLLLGFSYLRFGSKRSAAEAGRV